MRTTFLKAFILISILVVSHSVSAQDSSSVPKQVWPEVEAYYRINEKFRLYSLISGTRSNDEYTDGTFGMFIDYFALPWIKRKNYTELSDTARGYYWWFRMGYSYSDAPPSQKKKVINIYETESDNNIYLPAEIVLETRNRFDWRWVNGDFQPIYRPRLKFIRNLKTEYVTCNVYTWAEYFFYLNDHTQDRLRISIGTEIKVLRFLDFETYYMHQFQNKQYVAPLNAIGLQFDLYFKSKQYARLMESEQKRP